MSSCTSSSHLSPSPTPVCSPYASEPTHRARQPLASYRIHVTAMCAPDYLTGILPLPDLKSPSTSSTKFSYPSPKPSIAVNEDLLYAILRTSSWISPASRRRTVVEHEKSLPYRLSSPRLSRPSRYSLVLDEGSFTLNSKTRHAHPFRHLNPVVKTARHGHYCNRIA